MQKLALAQTPPAVQRLRTDFAAAQKAQAAVEEKMKRGTAELAATRGQLLVRLKIINKKRPSRRRTSRHSKETKLKALSWRTCGTKCSGWALGRRSSRG